MDTPLKNIEQYKQFQSITWVDSNETSTSARTIYFRVSDMLSFTVNYGPTRNCQLMSIANAQSLIKNENGVQYLKDILKVLHDKGLSKNMIMCDVKEDYVEPLKKLFEPYLKKNAYTEQTISLEAPYTSTNGSKMCIILFNINWGKIE